MNYFILFISFKTNKFKEKLHRETCFDDEYSNYDESIENARQTIFKLTEKICLDSRLRLDALTNDDIIELDDEEKSEEVVIIDSSPNIVVQK